MDEHERRDRITALAAAVWTEILEAAAETDRRAPHGGFVERNVRACGAESINNLGGNRRFVHPCIVFWHAAGRTDLDPCVVDWWWELTLKATALLMRKKGTLPSRPAWDALARELDEEEADDKARVALIHDGGGDQCESK